MTTSFLLVFLIFAFFQKLPDHNDKQNEPQNNENDPEDFRGEQYQDNDYSQYDQQKGF